MNGEWEKCRDVAYYFATRKVAIKEGAGIGVSEWEAGS